MQVEADCPRGGASPIRRRRSRQVEAPTWRHCTAPVRLPLARRAHPQSEAKHGGDPLERLKLAVAGIRISVLMARLAGARSGQSKRPRPQV
jgi:hypothetical protein